MRLHAGAYLGMQSIDLAAADVLLGPDEEGSFVQIDVVVSCCFAFVWIENDIYLKLKRARLIYDALLWS